MKVVTFLGDSLESIRAFPAQARRQAGFQLEKVQRGLSADNWRPMKSLGKGVSEIRIRDKAGAFRVIYVATLPKSVYVLHGFQKKTDKTARSDVELARTRYKELMRKQR